MSTIREKLDAYFAAELAITEALRAAGRRERWHVDPLDDARGYAWFVDGQSVTYWTPEKGEPSEYYSGEIPRGGVLRIEGLAVMVVDTNCDGNSFTMVFDEALEVTDAARIERMNEI